MGLLSKWPRGNALLLLIIYPKNNTRFLTEEKKFNPSSCSLLPLHGIMSPAPGNNAPEVWSKISLFVTMPKLALQSYYPLKTPDVSWKKSHKTLNNECEWSKQCFAEVNDVHVHVGRHIDVGGLLIVGVVLIANSQNTFPIFCEHRRRCRSTRSTRWCR